MPRILVVDNEGPIRSLLSDVLRGSGYNVSVARSGFEAIEIASALHPDLVMLDVNMPGFDGWATLAQLQASCPGIKVLMMSGTDYALEADERGAVAFLEKPYFPGDILDAVALAMGDAPGAPTRHAA